MDQQIIHEREARERRYRQERRRFVAASAIGGVGVAAVAGLLIAAFRADWSSHAGPFAPQHTTVILRGGAGGDTNGLGRAQSAELTPIVRTPQAIAADRINTRLIHDTQMTGSRVTAIVDPSGMATLIGFVQNQEQRAIAVRAADSTPGIASVKDKLEIRPTGGAGAIRIAGMTAVGGNGGRRRGGTTLNGGAAGGEDNGSGDDFGTGYEAGFNAGYLAGGQGSGNNAAAAAAENGADNTVRVGPALDANGNVVPDADATDQDPNAVAANGDQNPSATAQTNAAATTDNGTSLNIARNDSSYYGVNATHTSAYANNPGSAVSRQGSNFNTGNTWITGIGHQWGATPQNAGSQYAGAHSTTPH